MTYGEHINKLLREEVARAKELVCFGQNITTGSCIGGLTRGIQAPKGGRAINTPNAENTLVGFGFGMMMNGISSIFFMKQLDFLLLGIDHLVSTYNIIRSEKPKASFTIVPFVVDSGYEGPQSSFHGLQDICSLARVEGYSLAGQWDAEHIIKKHLISPGFRIIAVSQRLWREEIPEMPQPTQEGNGTFRYAKGDYATIVSFGFSLPQSLELWKCMEAAGKNTSLFQVSSAVPIEWGSILKDVEATKRIIVIEDSKSMHAASHALLAELAGAPWLKKKVVRRRTLEPNWPGPAPEKMQLDYATILQELT